MWSVVLIPSRSIANKRHIRFGQYSFMCFIVLPFAFVLPFLIGFVLSLPFLPGFVHRILVLLSLLCSVVLSLFVIRLWFRLYLRVDYPVLEVGQPGGIATFDLRDPAVCIEIKAGILTAIDASDGRRVRAWGVDGQKTGKNGFCFIHMERLAREFCSLLVGANGAIVVFEKDRPPSIPLSERFEVLSWREYRNPPNQRER